MRRIMTGGGGRLFYLIPDILPNVENGARQKIHCVLYLVFIEGIVSKSEFQKEVMSKPKQS